MARKMFWSEKPLLPQPLIGAPRLFYRSLLDFIRDLPKGAKRFWVLVLLTGLAGGLGAVLLLHLLRLVQNLSWPPGNSFAESVSSSPVWQRVLVPTLAGVAVTLMTLILREPLHESGTAGIIQAIWIKSGRMSFFKTLLHGGTSIVAVGMGAPLGREGALVETGAATGSILARKLKVSPDQVRLLVACGAAAGIAAAYNVPIGAAVFGLEVLLGSFALELFGPIVLSCVMATVVSRILIADHPSYQIPFYKLLMPKEFLLSVAFGPILGLASALFIKVINLCALGFARIPRGWIKWMPIFAMVPVGVAAIWLPQLLGNGYDAVDQALLGQLTLALAVILPMAKLLAIALTAGAGVPGGLFTPTLFYGALIGNALGQLAQYLWPGVAPPGAYALLGMGAALAGTTHASVSAVLIIFELTGNYGVILPLMLSTVLAAAVSRWLQPESIYTAALRRRNVILPGSPQWTSSASAQSLIIPDVVRVPPSARFDEVLLRLLEVPSGTDLYVTDSDSKLLGTIVLDSLKGHIPDHSLLNMTVAADVMDTAIKPVSPDLSLTELAARFSTTTLEKLPVVDGNGRLIGTISKVDILRHGHF
jgi:chloride channel protein, CIC family